MQIKAEVNFLKEDVFQIKTFPSEALLSIDKKKEGQVPGGPNPLEMFLSALAGCIGVYAKMYFGRHAVQFKRLEIQAEAEFTTDSPARLKDIIVKVNTDAQLADKEVFLRFVSNCPVHNTILHTKEVKINLI